MSSNKVTQTESLWSLCPDEFIARNACGSTEPIVTLKYCFTTLYTSDGIAIFLADSNIRGNDVLRKERAHCVVNQHEVVVAYSGFLQAVNAVMNRLLSIVAALEYPFQFRNHKLVGIRLKHGLPSVKAYDRYSVDVGMALKSQ